MLFRSLSGQGEYDFIVCRDLLTYFDAPTQARVLQTLHQALGRKGICFVSPAESPLLGTPDFEPLNIPNAHAFLKGRRRVRSAEPPARPLPHPTLTPPPMPPQPCTGAGGTVRTALDLALRLAERGQWPDVTRLCEAHVREHGESAQGLYLLGRALDAQGELEPAREKYQRALLLNSEHTLASLRLAQLPTAATPPDPSQGRLQP